MFALSCLGERGRFPANHSMGGNPWLNCDVRGGFGLILDPLERERLVEGTGAGRESC